jgi:hypothetical protein
MRTGRLSFRAGRVRSIFESRAGACCVWDWTVLFGKAGFLTAQRCRPFRIPTPPIPPLASSPQALPTTPSSFPFSIPSKPASHPPHPHPPINTQLHSTLLPPIGTADPLQITQPHPSVRPQALPTTPSSSPFSTPSKPASAPSRPPPAPPGRGWGRRCRPSTPPQTESLCRRQRAQRGGHSSWSACRLQPVATRLPLLTPSCFSTCLLAPSPVSTPPQTKSLCRRQRAQRGGHSRWSALTSHDTSPFSSLAHRFLVALDLNGMPRTPLNPHSVLAL